ncbi:hypothetical protein ACFY64_35220 [Streptomyces collinus]|uniref:hypothetical protein n=1 Tax=Streptomyces collinus TaxID=42684 RepID=UPI0036826782
MPDQQKPDNSPARMACTDQRRCRPLATSSGFAGWSQCGNEHHRVNALVALILFTMGSAAITACSNEQGDSRAAEVREATMSPKRQARARETAEAWDGSEAAAAWHKG